MPAHTTTDVATPSLKNTVPDNAFPSRARVACATAGAAFVGHRASMPHRPVVVVLSRKSITAIARGGLVLPGGTTRPGRRRPTCASCRKRCRYSAAGLPRQPSGFADCSHTASDHHRIGHRHLDNLRNLPGTTDSEPCKEETFVRTVSSCCCCYHHQHRQTTTGTAARQSSPRRGVDRPEPAAAATRR